MDEFNLYADMAKRTGGDIYIGVVGPVRTGKSTFIKRFMELAVLPGIQDTFQKERVIDELPQSAGGRTIMTTQPHFIPDEAAKLRVGDAVASIRLIDCVGYLTKGALGYLEDGAPRMVDTPWSDEKMPFEEAAELGTRKVIAEHATIGIVLTSDGSITEIPRAGYIEAEERVVSELKAIGKPFVMVLNTATPDNPDVRRLGAALSEKYDVAVRVMSVTNMTGDDIHDLLSDILYEFPLRELQIHLPNWAMCMPQDHYLPHDFLQILEHCTGDLSRMRDVEKILPCLNESSHIASSAVAIMDLSDGHAEIDLTLNEGLYHKLLSEACGVDVENDYQLLIMLRDFAAAKREYDRLEAAIQSAKETGYGMVPPTSDEMKLEEPEIVRQGGRFGVKLKASAPSLHLMRVEIQTEVSPVVGTEKQSEELVKYLLSEFENDPQEIWNTNIFGKSLHDLVKEGLSNKLSHMPEDARSKMSETLSRVINEGSGGLICILL